MSSNRNLRWKKCADRRKKKFKLKKKKQTNKKKQVKKNITVKIETDRGVTLAKLIFSCNFIFSTVFHSHTRDLQGGKIWIAIFFDRDLYKTICCNYIAYNSIR
jgi:hypothetical protein